MIRGFRYWKLEHIRGLDIRSMTEHRYKLRQVIEPCEPCFSAVARSFGRKLYRGYRFTEGRSPCVEMLQALFAEPVVLKVALHCVKLGHGVRHRCTRCEDRASIAREFIEVSALHKHIRGFLRFGLGEPRNVSHFCVQEKVFVIMCFVYEHTVNAELLEGYNVIFS